MRRRVLDVIRSPKEFLRMPRPGTNPPRRMGNDTAGPRFLFVKRQPQRRCPVVFGPGGSLASLLLGMIIYLQMRPPSSLLSVAPPPLLILPLRLPPRAFLLPFAPFLARCWTSVRDAVGRCFVNGIGEVKKSVFARSRNRIDDLFRCKIYFQVFALYLKKKGNKEGGKL